MTKVGLLQLVVMLTVANLINCVSPATKVGIDSTGWSTKKRLINELFRSRMAIEKRRQEF